MNNPSKLRISWSSLRSHEECRHRGHLLRKGLRSSRSDVRVYFHGLVVDRVMRAWLDDLEYPVGGMEALVPLIMDSEEERVLSSGDGVVRWKNATDRAYVTDLCITAVRGLEPILREHVIPYEYEVAKRFKVPMIVPFLDGTPTEIDLVGELDLLVKTGPDKFSVWDLKVSSDPNYWRKTLGQLIFYHVAMTTYLGVEPSVVGLFQPLHKEGVLSWVVSERQKIESVTSIARMAADVWARDFSFAEDSSNCYNCNVKHACEKFKRPLLTSAMTFDTLVSRGNGVVK